MQIPEHIRQVYARSTCLYSTTEVELALDHMASDIHKTLCDEHPVLLCVMIGGLVPTGNLLPRLDFPLALDYIHATRYQGKIRGAELQWKASPSIDLKDRSVLIVDDVLDEGVTLAKLVAFCQEAGAKKVYTAVLVDKPERRVAKGLPKADFVGLEVADHFIFGYGMDYKEHLRNAPGIYMVASEDEVE